MIDITIASTRNNFSLRYKLSGVARRYTANLNMCVVTFLSHEEMSNAVY